MHKLISAGLLLAILVGCAPKEEQTQNNAGENNATESAAPAAEASAAEMAAEHAEMPEADSHDMNHDMSTEDSSESMENGDEIQAMMHMVMFEAPAEGAELKSPVHVKMGVDGMTVQAAGEVVENTGHHHLIIDGDPIPQGEVVPADEKHLHFGKGQTETDVELTPGQHTLTLQFADGAHKSYGPDMSATISITVVE